LGKLKGLPSLTQLKQTQKTKARGLQTFTKDIVPSPGIGNVADLQVDFDECAFMAGQELRDPGAERIKST
jgi:hypothetical protein